MGVLDDLIGLCDLTGRVDLRCQMSGDCRVEHEASPEGHAVFHIVLSGTARLDLPNQPPQTAQSGAMILLPHGQAHRIRPHGGTGPGQVRQYPGLLAPAPGAADLDLLCGHFTYDPMVGPMLFDGLPSALVLRPDICGDTLAAVTDMIRHEAADAAPGAVQIVTSLMTALFVLALRHRLDAPEVGLDRGMIALLGDPALAPAITAMYRQPEQAWSVATLAELAGMSRASFARRFAERAGRGPAQTLLAVRCQLALQQLRRTKRSVAEIAHSLGYACDISFGKAFSRQMGMTPVAARKAYQSDERSEKTDE